MSMNRVWNGVNVLAPRISLYYSTPSVVLPIFQNRLFSQTGYNFDAVKPNIKLLAKLRQETQVSMTKAKEALIKCENVYEKAIEWLQEDAVASGTKKAEKLASRTASEGLVALVLNNSSSEFGATSTGALVDLSCETDFVSRNELFQQLATRISSTALFLEPVSPNNSGVFKAIHEASIENLQSAPLMPHPSSTEADIDGTVQEGIAETIGKLGENIVLRRVAVSSGISNESEEELITSGYVHGGDQSTGKIGALVVLGVAGKPKQPEELQKFARQLARQVVGFNPKYLSESHASIPEDVSKQEFLEQNVLLNQSFMMGGGSVHEVVESYSKSLDARVRILDFVRYEVGEGIEKPVVADFREEVMSQLKK